MADDAAYPPHGPRIGLIRDRSFWFYYPENLHLLTEMGADLIEVNALTDGSLPELDALYIGGGFPETHCEALAGNKSFPSIAQGRDPNAACRSMPNAGGSCTWAKAFGSTKKLTPW